MREELDNLATKFGIQFVGDINIGSKVSAVSKLIAVITFCIFLISPLHSLPPDQFE